MTLALCANSRYSHRRVILPYMTVGSARHWIERCVARVLLALFACGTSSGALCADLVVSAATSLTNAFKEIGTLFSAANPGTHVAFNFASSDILLAQIVKGAPADVFAAADQDAMDRAEQSDSLLRGSRRNFATNRLVVIVPAGAAPMSALSDLTGRPYARIAVGSPQSVPAGRYAKGALERAVQKIAGGMQRVDNALLEQGGGVHHFARQREE